ncbi:reverse transcriptase domain-containing protein [Tanacetum coccineum]
MMVEEDWMNVPIVFPLVRARDLSKEAIMVEAEIEGYLVRRIHVDEGESIKIMYEHCFNMLHPAIKAGLTETQTTVVEPVEVVRPQEKVNPIEEVLVNPSYLDQLVTIGKNLSPESFTQLKNLLKNNKDIFAWEPSDMTRPEKKGILPRKKPSGNSRSGQMAEGWDSQASKVPHVDFEPSFGKGYGSWRMCIDFKNINSACPKDYYPLPEIDHKIDSVMGFPFKCFLDAYKGYHRVQMAEEDEEKTAFYTDQGTFFYTKMPFGLKNAGATYQRLVDEAFQS